MDQADGRWVRRVRLGVGLSGAYLAPLVMAALEPGHGETMSAAEIGVCVGASAWLMAGREPGRADVPVAWVVRWAGVLVLASTVSMAAMEAVGGDWHVSTAGLAAVAAVAGWVVAIGGPAVMRRLLMRVPGGPPGTWPVRVAQVTGGAAWGVLAARLLGMPGGRGGWEDLAALGLGVIPGVVAGWVWWKMRGACVVGWDDEPDPEAAETMDAEVEEGTTLCPGCGYDLRAATEDRCSECGLVIDRRRLRVSGFAWAHRERIGTLRAYARTVWGVTRDDTRLRHEAARVQDPADGRAFRRVTAGVVAATLLATWGWIMWENKGLGFLAYPLWQGWRTVAPDWYDDLVVSWSAGATMAWVVPVCLILLAVYLTGVQQAVFRAGRMPQVYRRRVGAIAHYAAAPLALGLPSLALLAMAPAAGRGVGMAALALAVRVAAGVTAFAALAGSLVRVGQWVSRVRHAGFATGALAAMELLALWAWGVVLTLGLVPWSIGYSWIVIDSFRR